MKGTSKKFKLERKLSDYKLALQEVREGIIELKVEDIIIRDKIKECKERIKKIKKERQMNEK